tara:strand:- start:57 stop:308 length:252 start_codon:yes stop_codon:yes gene_type:complete
MGNGKMIKKVEKEFSNGLMEKSMKAILKMILDMVKVFIIGLMEIGNLILKIGTTEIGYMVKKKDKDYVNIKIKINITDNGKQD